MLDLGAGGGFDCFLAARQAGPTGRVVGVDMTPDMVTRARANAARLEAKNVWELFAVTPAGCGDTRPGASARSGWTRAAAWSTVGCVWTRACRTTAAAEGRARAGAHRNGGDAMTGSCLTAAFFVLVLSVTGPAAGGPTKARFDPSAWQADFRALKAALEQRYGHLAWFASPEGGVDLPALERETARALGRARDDSAAAAAIRGFVAGFRDGHMTPVAVPPPSAGAAAVPVPPEPPPPEAAPDARTACAAWGYAPMSRTPFTLPFEGLPQVTLLSDGIYEPFRTALVEVAGVRLAVLRIPRFRASQYPALCEGVWAAIRARGRTPTREAVSAEVDAAWLRTLAERLRRAADLGAAALLIDVGDNGGGNDLGDWAVRLFTAAPVRSAPMLMVRGPVSVPYFDVQLEALNTALQAHPNVPEASRAALEAARAGFERRKREALTTACDMSWVWRARRPWGTSPCTQLLDGGFASGALDYAEPGALDPAVAPALYWASAADALRGAWTRPTYVLTDPSTGSAAEAFVALMRDRGVAKTIGRRTRGLGCGFVDFDEPFVLPHSRLAFRIPNCARLRGDGTDEVAGIAPDLPMAAEPGESPRALSLRVLQAIAAEVRAPRPR